MNLTLLSQQARHADHQAVEAAAFILALRPRGVRNTAVLGAMERARRELFAPRRFADLARTDVALPLPCGQTMTAPSVVAAMLSALAPEGGRALEIGTGSGWVTAVLARSGCRVCTVERYATLAESAAGRFARRRGRRRDHAGCRRLARAGRRRGPLRPHPGQRRRLGRAARADLAARPGRGPRRRAQRHGLAAPRLRRAAPGRRP